MAAVLRDDGARGFPQVLRAPTVAKPRPHRKNVAEARVCKRQRRRKSLQECAILRDHPGDLRLLQHHLGDEDRIWVAGSSPRQIPSALAIPREGSTRKTSHRDGGVKYHSESDGLLPPLIAPPAGM